MEKKDKNELLCVYLINGEDHLKRDRAISRMKMRLEKIGDLSFNSDTFDARSAEGQSIVDACLTLPFASEKRLVLVNDADKLSRESQNAISDYLQNPNPSSVLLLVSDKLSRTSKLYKTVSQIDKNAVIDCTPVKARDLANHVRQLAPGHGITITLDAANALIELVGEDTLRLDSELEKLALTFSGQPEITKANVLEVVARTNEPKPWHFLDAFSDRDMKAALDILLKMNSTSCHSLLRQCVSRIRELICAKSMMNSNNFSIAALAKELDVQDWRVKRHSRYASKFSMEELEGALCSSLVCEKEMKSGADPDAAFEYWLIEVLSKPR